MNKGPLVEIFTAALAAVDPYHAVSRALRLEDGSLYAGGNAYDLAAFDRVIVVGAGKATARMAEAVEDILGNVVTTGFIVVKYGHAGKLRTVGQTEAGHPIPDEAGVRGTGHILELVQNAGERTLIILLLSGGGSSLLVAPLPGITLGDKQKTTDLLLKTGASIDELNTVRKHLSAVKGGRLARMAFPAHVATLVLSDVIGDRLDVIASGPTSPDSTTYADAAFVIAKYGLKPALPQAVAAFLERGASGKEPETAKNGEACFLKCRHVVVGSIAQALAAAREKARALGFAPDVVTAELQGEAREAARTLARTALRVRDSMKPGERRCLLFGGETTVTVHGKGKGGRNQELALAFALEISGLRGITLLSAGTDGTDGPTDAAGAVVDADTVQLARARGMHPEAYLGNNDSYAFFLKVDSFGDSKHHIKTGPTGTNVMDMQIVVIEAEPNGAAGRQR